ncbi:hypothetical protein CRYUN_Cryun03dG0066500 [Craigia yunnanensis]
MKEPSLSRLRKNCANPPRKLKLVCSFNGAFHPRLPSGKLRYIGGETRILSVDRNIGFLKLRAKIADLCPKVMSFWLKYQVAVADVDLDMDLVVIESDEDVRCMVEEYENMELYGKRARLWVFVCSNGHEYGQFYKGQVDNKVTKNVRNSGNGSRLGDDSLRKMVLKQQLLAKHMGRISGIQGISGFGVNESGMKFAFYDKNQKFDHPLIDLGSQEPRVIVSEEENLGGNLLDCEMRNLGPQMCPLKPRDGNLLVKNNGSMQFLPEQSGGVMCNGLGVLGQSDAASLCLKQQNNSGVISMCNGFDAKHDLRSSKQRSLSNFNTENITPCYNSVNTHLEPVYYNNQWSASPHNTKTGEAVWGNSQNLFQNHKFSMNDLSNQRTYPYSLRNHRNNLSGIGNHRIVKLDGRLSSGKYCPRVKPNSNISKQGHSARSCYSNLWKPWPGLPEHASLEEATMMTHLSNPDFPYGNSKPRACHLAHYGAWAGVGSQSLFINKVIDSPSPGISMIDDKRYLMVGANYGLAVPYQTPFENCHAGAIVCEPIHCYLQNRRSVADSQDVITNSASSNDVRNTQLSDADACKSLKSNYNDGDGTHNLQGGIASSVDLLCNLSMSSSKGMQPPALSSHGSNNVSDSMVMPQSRPLDLMDEVHMDIGPQVDQSSDNASNSSPTDMDELVKDHIQGEAMQHDHPSDLSINEKSETKDGKKCSKVIGRISCGQTAFYTQELQTIRSSDLEYIKELGAGAYGTVFYGKWKGSDVAIKRLKPSCFSEGSVEEERLVAEFWKEAHILGQLHHPNIVALYGVVTDGPLTSLATVAEYMVNGSLKQVLRRKDRTIDRRKRLIIAMDAAFGMEYLHEKNIVHFDLKSHNFLVNMRDPWRPVCKIGDLGLSKIKQRTLVSGGVRGTIPWMAPELLNAKNNLVTEKVDVYSYGIVMWELLTGEEPYTDFHSEEIIAGIIKGTLRPEIPSWCDPAWRLLMERCWSTDPDSRPAFSEIAKELRTMSAAMNIK